MILCCGEALIDMLPRAAAFVPQAGGAVFNTAIALGRLGVPTGFFSGLSTDLFGKVLEDALAGSHVDATLAARSDRPTTLAFVKLNDGQAEYAFYDENTAGRMLALDDLPDLPDAGTTCFFGGISLAVEPCANAYAALQERVCQNTVVMLDPNVRPGFIQDEAAYRTRISAMIARTDILKLSDEDLRWLDPDESDIDVLAARMLDRGPAGVFFTYGANGARGYSKSASHAHDITSKLDVIDTVGAGDTFNAGVLAALHKDGKLTKAALRDIDEQALQNALSLGTRTAAVTVSRAGANPPWAHEL